MNAEICKNISLEKLGELRMEISDKKFVSRIIETEGKFKALADEKRLVLFHLLGMSELCVCDISSILNSPQPTISNELKELFRAGLISRRKEGRWIYYSASIKGEKLLEAVSDE